MLENIDRKLKEALLYIHNNSKHQLPLRYRDAIYKLLGSRDNRFSNQVRGWIGIISARYVLPIILAKTSQRDSKTNKLLPEYVLETAEKTIRDDISMESEEYIAAKDRAAYYSEYAWKEDERLFSPNANYAGSAIYCALLQVDGNIPINFPSNYETKDYKRLSDFKHISLRDLTDSDIIDSYGSPNVDSAFFAVKAYALANNNPELPIVLHKFDPAKCQEFWQWWLTEAIPAAWEQASKQDTPKGDSSKPEK